MKHIKLFESFNDFPNTKEEIVKLCKKYVITNYTINDDMSIDVDGRVNLYDQRLSKLPLNFNKVSGHFYCIVNQLTTLEGAPNTVGGNFNCQYNQLTTLIGGPEYVGCVFYCKYNPLKSSDYKGTIKGNINRT
jgi:hypothetical protein